MLGTYKTKIETLELAPFSDGRFEVFRDGKKIYSKHDTGQFPEWEELEDALGGA